jgi:hypothetical protein
VPVSCSSGIVGACGETTESAPSRELIISGVPHCLQNLAAGAGIAPQLTHSLPIILLQPSD